MGGHRPGAHPGAGGVAHPPRLDRVGAGGVVAPGARALHGDPPAPHRNGRDDRPPLGRHRPHAGVGAGPLAQRLAGVQRRAAEERGRGPQPRAVALGEVVLHHRIAAGPRRAVRHRGFPRGGLGRAGGVLADRRPPLLLPRGGRGVKLRRLRHPRAHPPVHRSRGHDRLRPPHLPRRLSQRPRRTPAVVRHRLPRPRPPHRGPLGDSGERPALPRRAARPPAALRRRVHQHRHGLAGERLQRQPGRAANSPRVRLPST